MSFDKSKWLMNGCESEKLARCNAAVNAHMACTGTQMIRVEEGDYWLEMAEYFGFKVGPQETLHVSMAGDMGIPNSDKAALIFANLDLVVLCDEWEEREGGKEGEWCRFIEPNCAMTTANFFRYLGTIPNLLHFAMEGKHPRANVQEGLQLLAELAERH